MNGHVPRTKSPSNWSPSWKASRFRVDGRGLRGRRQLHRRQEESQGPAAGGGALARADASAHVPADGSIGQSGRRSRALQSDGHGRLSQVFVGIETPSLAGLAECHKVHNTRGDLVDAVRTIQGAGLEVMGGFIVGFDSDPPTSSNDSSSSSSDQVWPRPWSVADRAARHAPLPAFDGRGRIEAESGGDNTGAVLNFRPKLDRSSCSRATGR